MVNLSVIDRVTCFLLGVFFPPEGVGVVVNAAKHSQNTIKQGINVFCQINQCISQVKSIYFTS